MDKSCTHKKCLLLKERDGQPHHVLGNQGWGRCTCQNPVNTDRPNYWSYAFASLRRAPHCLAYIQLNSEKYLPFESNYSRNLDNIIMQILNIWLKHILWPDTKIIWVIKRHTSALVWNYHKVLANGKTFLHFLDLHKVLNQILSLSHEQKGSICLLLRTVSERRMTARHLGQKAIRSRQHILSPWRPIAETSCTQRTVCFMLGKSIHILLDNT